MSASFTQEEVNINDGLHAGDFPIRSKPVTLISGQNLKRGAVLGIITASDKATLSLSASSDGSEDVNCILAEDTDASSGDVETIAYITGDFNSNKLTFGTGHTAASTRDAFRDLSIFIVEAVPA